MKIFINRMPKHEPYGGGNQFLSALVNHLRKKSYDVVFDLQENIDIIFIMDPRPGEIQNISINEILDYKNKNQKTKLLHRVNECDARKNTNFIDSILLQTMLKSDKVIFISEWLQNYFFEKGFSKKSEVVYNGCDTNHFYPNLDVKIKNNSKLKIVTHHWSDNWMKGFDIYTQIDKYLVDNPNFEFTYIGRYNKNYITKQTIVIPPLYGKNLGDELRKHDIYVTASRFEPCGMHHIEAAASGIPVLYHQDGGGINELATKHGLPFSNFEDFIIKLSEMVENIQHYKNQINYDYLSIDRCCSEFEMHIKSLHN